MNTCFSLSQIVRVEHMHVEHGPSKVSAEMLISDPTAHIQGNWVRGSFYEEQMLTDIWWRFRDKGPNKVLDVGACVGNHSVWFARVFPFAQIIAVEPQPMYARHLEANVLYNSLGNVKVIRAGLSATPGSAFIAPISNGNEGMWRLSESHGIPVGTMTVDMVLSYRAPGIDLIKIDVEGWEIEVLKGAKQTLEQHRPMLYIEGDRGQLDEFLLPLGYKWQTAMNHTPTHCYTHAR